MTFVITVTTRMLENGVPLAVVSDLLRVELFDRNSHDEEIRTHWNEAFRKAVEEVFEYSTDFAAMRHVDIEHIANCGEQLTRSLIPYCRPEL